jgi:hypothetical protein
MIALNRSLLNREYIRINVLKLGVGVVLAVDSQSTSSPGYRATIRDP